MRVPPRPVREALNPVLEWPRREHSEGQGLLAWALPCPVLEPLRPVLEGPGAWVSLRAEMPVRWSPTVVQPRPVREQHLREEVGAWWGSEVGYRPYGVSCLGAGPLKFGSWWSCLGQAIVSCSG